MKKTAGSKPAGKKTAAAGAAAKPGGKKPSRGKGKDPSREEYASAYIRLRTVMDSLEMIALRYTLEKPGQAERTRRADEVVTMLKPIVHALTDRIYTSALPPGECPDGYYNCNDCCIPYPCPDTRKF